MRLSYDIIENSSSFINPLGFFELDLRGNKIQSIENFFITKDKYEIIDLSDNDLSKIENIPLLVNLKGLFLCNNKITYIDENLGEKLPNLRILNLYNNRISSLEIIKSLKSLSHLEILIISDNPISLNPKLNYFISSTLPNLKVLDFNFFNGININTLLKDNSDLSKDAIKDILQKAKDSNEINDLKKLEKLIHI